MSVDLFYPLMDYFLVFCCWGVQQGSELPRGADAAG
jgi:hypothetical protein